VGTWLSDAEFDRLAGVERIHLVWKTHFDLGFTDFAARVRARYLDDFLPRAIDLARRSREEGRWRFVWTVGSWLVYESLEHGNAAIRDWLEEAIAHGDITWTAAPFTPHSELMGRDLFALGLTLSERLDTRFGSTRSRRTSQTSQATRSESFLCSRGRVFVSCTSGSTRDLLYPPCPRRSCGAPGEDAEIAVSYNQGYGGVTRFGSSPEALLIVFRDDNVGPPEPADVSGVYAELERGLPGVQIDATGMNAFTAVMDPWRAELPHCRWRAWRLVDSRRCNRPGEDRRVSRPRAAAARMAGEWRGDRVRARRDLPGADARR
jgi:hypothetical protein